MMMLWHAMVNTGEITPSRFVELTSTAPAKMFGMYPRKGTIAIGADADIVIWDAKRRHVHSVKTHHMNIDYNLYEGIATRGGPVQVFSRGDLVVDGDKWLGSPGRGRFVHRGSAQF
jgi:dihydropyrimidinase